MEQEHQDSIMKAAGIAGGAALVSPIAVPVVSGLAAIAVAGLGVFTIGSMAFKAIGAISGGGLPNPFARPDGEVEREAIH